MTKNNKNGDRVHIHGIMLIATIEVTTYCVHEVMQIFKSNCIQDTQTIV